MSAENHISPEQASPHELFESARAGQVKIGILRSEMSESFRAVLPDYPQAFGILAEKDAHRDNTLYIHDINIGIGQNPEIEDIEIMKEKIAGNLLEAVVAEGLSRNGSLENVRTVWATEETIGLFASVFEPENVTVHLSQHDKYGFGTDKPLQTVFDQSILKGDSASKVWEISAHIHPVQAQHLEQSKTPSV